MVGFFLAAAQPLLPKRSLREAVLATAAIAARMYSDYNDEVRFKNVLMVILVVLMFILDVTKVDTGSNIPVVVREIKCFFGQNFCDGGIVKFHSRVFSFLNVFGLDFVANDPILGRRGHDCLAV